jgi:hypothetical protein
MLLYEGLFLKANGDLRSMRFIRLSDIPKNILEAKTHGNKSKPSRGDIELVWDIDHRAFKYFNHKTRVGNLTSRALDSYMEYFE